MSDKIDVTPEAVERFEPEGYNGTLSAWMRPEISGDWVRYEDYAALSARLAEVEADVVEWKRQALYHNAEHGKLVVIQCETEAQLARAVEALERMAEAWENVIEMDIINPRHRTTAQVLRNDARATLAEIGEGHE
jgi:nitrate reductase NapAB chaperone NapD